jgi:hypothetical protein
MPEMQNEAAELIDHLIISVETELHRNCTEEARIPYGSYRTPPYIEKSPRKRGLPLDLLGWLKGLEPSTT